MPPVYHDRPPRFGPMTTWRLSIRLYQRGHHRLAKLIKAFNYLFFRAILPPEATVGEGVRLEHYGLGIVLHPNTTIGDRVRIYQHAMVGSDAEILGPDRVIIGDDVVIGMGTKIANSRGHTLTIGDGANIGAHSLVTRDVPAGARVRAQPSTVLPPQDQDPLAPQS